MPTAGYFTMFRYPVRVITGTETVRRLRRRWATLMGTGSSMFSFRRSTTEWTCLGFLGRRPTACRGPRHGAVRCVPGMRTVAVEVPGGPTLREMSMTIPNTRWELISDTPVDGRNTISFAAQIRRLMAAHSLGQRDDRAAGPSRAPLFASAHVFGVSPKHGRHRSDS